MSGGFSAGGLITGMDSNNIIRQLMQLERQPIVRMRQRIDNMEAQRTAVRNLRTQLQTLRSRAQDFRLTNPFESYAVESSETDVLTAQAFGGTPPQGAFKVEVLQLASATVARSGTRISASIDPNAPLSGSGISQTVDSGTFTINGVQLTVDADADSLQDVLNMINVSAAGVTATYDAVTDKVTFENTAPGNTSIIKFGASEDESNLLQALRVTQATQSTGGNGSTVVSSNGHLGAITQGTKLDDESFAGGAVTGGSFSINGVSISIDPTEDSLSDIIARINSSEAGVIAAYDSANDTIRIQSNALGSRTISFGSGGDTSNFLTIMNLDTATQTAGKDAQFKVDDGPVETRNSNEITDAVSGLSLRLASEGKSTINVSTDNSATLNAIRGLLEEFNNAAERIREMTGQEGRLRGDSGIRNIESAMRGILYSLVSAGGTYDNIVAVGVNTGKDFESSGPMRLQLNEEAFLEALGEQRTNVQNLFSNEGKTGIADQLFEYLDGITGTNGLLNTRIRANGTIDRQTRLINDQIENMEQRLLLREDRMRRSFTRLEQLSAGFQQQSVSLSGLASNMRRF